MAIVQAHVAAVQQMYVAYFNRPADSAGLDYWTNVVEANKGATAAVSASFAKSPEYIVAYYNLTSTQIVDKIYLNMFGRGASTTDGRSYWVDLLASGKVSVDIVVAEVAKGARGTDAESVENKVAAATAFTAALDTPAENAGYAGEAALTAAKAFITGVTTDATLNTAIAPAALSATVAAVVKAGTPFSLDSALSTLQTANKSFADFLEDNDLPATAAAAKTAVDNAVSQENADLDVLVTGDYATASSGVKAALLADQQRTNTNALNTANTNLATANANAAAVTGLSAAISNLRAANEAKTEADKAATAAATELNVADAAFEARLGASTTITTTSMATGADLVTIPGAAAGDPAIVLITVNARGNVALEPGVTEEDYPGVTALRDALAADIDARADATAAATAATNAANESVITANSSLVTAVDTAYTAQATAQTNIEKLADAVAERADAIALQTQYTAAAKAVTDAEAAFGANGYTKPIALTGAAAGTSGSDIFMAGTTDVSITSFGRSGNDALFVGTQYTMGTDIDAGNNAVMEVFFVQNGTRAEVHVEQAAYGSASDDVTVITLIGVDADDLQLVNGIVSLKAGA